MGKALHVNEKEFDTQVLQAEQPVLVDFWAGWCGPCRMIAPIIEDLAVEYDGKAKVVKVDVDENHGVANRYGIMSIPTLEIFKRAVMLDRLVGYLPYTETKKR